MLLSLCRSLWPMLRTKMENLVGCRKCINLSFLIHGLKKKVRRERFLLKRFGYVISTKVIFRTGKSISASRRETISLERVSWRWPALCVKATQLIMPSFFADVSENNVPFPNSQESNWVCTSLAQTYFIQCQISKFRKIWEYTKQWV